MMQYAHHFQDSQRKSRWSSRYRILLVIWALTLVILSGSMLGDMKLDPEARPRDTSRKVPHSVQGGRVVSGEPKVSESMQIFHGMTFRCPKRVTRGIRFCGEHIPIRSSYAFHFEPPFFYAVSSVDLSHKHLFSKFKHHYQTLCRVLLCQDRHKGFAFLAGCNTWVPYLKKRRSSRLLGPNALWTKLSGHNSVDIVRDHAKSERFYFRSIRGVFLVPPDFLRSPCLCVACDLYGA